MSIEEQLAAYRAKKDKERQSTQPLYRRLFSHGQMHENKNDNPTNTHVKLDTSTSTPSTVKTHHSPEPQPSSRNHKYYLTLALKISLWLVLWKFFIEVGFGAVFFIASGFLLMWLNTRTGPRDTSKLSAYSVFNPNHEQLDGTFTSEQFERELRFGPASVN